MRTAALAIFGSLGLCCVAAPARTPTERLKDARLEAVHSQIVEWKETRADFPVEGVYQDYRAVFLPEPAAQQILVEPAHNAGVRVVFGAATMGVRDGVLFLHAPDADFKGTDIFGLPQVEDAQRLPSKFKQRPDEAFGTDVHTPEEPIPTSSVLFARTHLPPAKVTKDLTDAYTAAFRHATTHILATELTPAAIQASLAAGHAYVAHDWLCDPTGMAFIAQSYFGVFEIGDTVVHNPLTGAVTISARFPVPATIRLLRDNLIVAEAHDWRLDYIVRDTGAYRVEASLSIDGEERPWIFTNPITVGPPSSVTLPSAQISPNVEMVAGISYVVSENDGAPADADKHKLDLYLPRDKKNFPVLVFLHGGSWRAGDRSVYRALGDRLARAGIGVAIPSYRLMPQNPHPAQIEDAAAAFAWVAKNIAQRGGDASRIYLSGHSAGAHLAALLALDEKYLGKFGLPRRSIHGVIAMSGIYNVDTLDTFVAAGDRHDASPYAHAHSGAPPFLISYCQWDYFGLPKQARDFTRTLKKNFVAAELLYVPGENHISEVISLVQDHGLLIDTILSVVNNP